MIDWHNIYSFTWSYRINKQVFQGRFSNLIVVERKNKTVLDKFDRFGKMMTDGRLTMSSDGKIYRLWEAILLSKKLGRTLSKDMKNRNQKYIIL